MIIAIASGKGGTGKTTLAVNLALRAAEKQKVALLDLDVEEPNSGIFVRGNLELERRMFTSMPVWEQPNCTLCGRCSEVCNYHAVLKIGTTILVLPELCHACYACSELCPTNSLPMADRPLGWLRHYRLHSLDFVESKLDIGVEMATPLIGRSIAYANDHLGDAKLQIRDCPPGTACSVINATKDADFVILVTEPTPFGLHDLGLAVETMRHLGKPMAVAVNRVGIGNDDVFRYCAQEGISVWAKIPNDRKVAELYSKGEIIYDKVTAVREGLDHILQNLSRLGEKP
jgi:MinD superfamily P-loop ATPase